MVLNALENNPSRTIRFDAGRCQRRWERVGGWGRQIWADADWNGARDCVGEIRRASQVKPVGNTFAGREIGALFPIEVRTKLKSARRSIADEETGFPGMNES